MEGDPSPDHAGACASVGGARRLQDRQPDRNEASGEAFQRRVAAGFGRLARERGWRRVAADQAPAAVSAAIQALLQAELGAETGHG